MIRRPPRSTRTTHSFPTRRSSDLGGLQIPLRPDAMSAPTPMMAQYLALKAEAEDCLLFYRMGDFFELFFDDAHVAAACLDIALTSRGAHEGEKIPMCGVPAHAAESYLARLIKAGHRVAIADQTETPAEAKKRGGSKALVARGIVRVVTAGTLTEERSEEHTSELQSLMRISYAVFCL